MKRIALAAAFLLAGTAHAAPNIGDCIAQRTSTVKYITCAPSGTPGVWATALSPLNVAVQHRPFVDSNASYFGRYGHEISLQVATALGKPASAASCGTPVGERYQDAKVYEKLPTVCPALPATYTITPQDRNDMKMASYGGSTWYDVFIAPSQPTTPKPDFCNNPAATCHPACPAPPPPCEACATLAAVPQDVRDTINAAPNWKTIGAARKAQLQRVKAWLALVDSYKPRVQSTGASVIQ